MTYVFTDTDFLMHNSNAYMWKCDRFDLEVYLAKDCAIGDAVWKNVARIKLYSKDEMDDVKAKIDDLLLCEAFKAMSADDIDKLLTKIHEKAFNAGVKHTRKTIRRVLGIEQDEYEYEDD